MHLSHKTEGVFVINNNKIDIKLFEPDNILPILQLRAILFNQKLHLHFTSIYVHNLS